MIDPDFDPLDELRQAQDMINQLIVAHNNHDELLMAYSKQHQQVVDLIRKTQQQISRLEFDIRKLKNEN